MSDICLQCGRCCYHCSVSEDKLVRTDVPCKYLNTVSHLCEKYLDRFWLDVVCLTIQEATRQRVLPSDCPYVADVADYAGPEERATIAVEEDGDEEPVVDKPSGSCHDSDH